METKLIYGEELRDELLLVRSLTDKLPLGELVRATASYTAYRDRCEQENKNVADYICVRELLNSVIEDMVEELNDRERKILGLRRI